MKNIYSVFDSKTAVFCLPFFAVNDGTALRDFKNAALDPTSGIGRNPEDYTLFRVGSFNDDTGAIAAETPVALATAAALKMEV